MRTVVSAVLVAVLATSAFAQSQGQPAGALVGDQGVKFPLTLTEVEADVSGGVARVTLRQHFENPFASPVNVEYVFPLPDDAAVTALRMELGNRLVESRVTRRGDAERTYEEAKERGQTAALGSQIRANVFRQRISHVMPGEQVRVEIVYVEELAFDSGSYSFVFPVVAAPRFRRPAEGPSAFLHGDERPGHLLELTARIDGGTPIGNLRSPSHEIEVRYDGAARAQATISRYDRLPVKDFVLEWDTDSPLTAGTEAGVIAHRSEATGFFQLVLMPEAESAAAPPMPREIVFVLDCSGSMKGMPLATAKRIVERTLDRLAHDDTFRILRFSDEASAISDAPLFPNRRSLSRAYRYLDGLKATGGTQVLSGVRLALEPPTEPGRVRVVHFITDGLIGNEAEVLEVLSRLVGDARVFPLGIGSSPNRFLIERMADVGRGAPAFLRQDAPEADVVASVHHFVERIRTPVLTNVWIDWGGLPVADVVPARLPDLFAGQPVTVNGRYLGGAAGEITLCGSRAGESVVRRFPVTLPEYEPGNTAVPPLWARARIRELLLAEYAGEAQDVEAEVTEIALAHQLLSKYTAFVAVDRRTVNPGGQAEDVVQPAPWPEGVGGADFQGVLLWTPRGSGAPTRKAPVVKVYVPGPTMPTFGKIDAVKDLHLSFLVSWQEKDGSWKAGGDLFGPTGVTALSTLALTASHRVPGEGLYGKSLAAALTWLDRAQGIDGLVGERRGDAWLLDHALATLALEDGCVATNWKWGYSRAKRAVRFLVEHQAPGLGWAANGVGDGDTLTTALAVLALTRAQDVRIKFDPAVLDGAREFLRRVTDRDTGLVSMSPLDAALQSDGVAIASALIAELDLGTSAKNTSWVGKGARALREIPPPTGDLAHPLYLFLCGSALKRIGGDAWSRWNAPLNEASRKGMIPREETDEAGNALTVGPKGAKLGRAAAMALFGMTRALFPKSGGSPFTVR